MENKNLGIKLLTKEKIKKITKATFKSFINKNRENLYILVKSRFDGMVDCVTDNPDRMFKKAEKNDYMSQEHNLGINGLWIVGGGRDWFSHFENEHYVGLEYSNCCGSAVIAIKK